MITEEYINNVLDGNVYIQEGILTWIRDFFDSSPRDPKLRGLNRAYVNARNKCEVLYPDEGVQFKAKFPIGDTDIDIDYENFKDNPDQTICMLNAEYEYLKALIQYMKSTTPEALCADHHKRDKCIKWCKETLPEAELQLKLLKNSIDKLDRVASEREAKMVFNNINKLK